MCAFIPASANWSGEMPWRDRCAKSGAQAGGVVAGSVSFAATAERKSPAKQTSSRSRNGRSANV